MSYLESKEDGIEMVGRFYKIPCCVCGIEYVNSTHYSRKRKYTCKTCKLNERTKETEEQYLKKEKKFKNALKRIKNTVGSTEGYEDAIEKVYKTLHRSDWYRSTEEIMVAIELLKNGIKTIHQQKIGKYRVDFVLPDYKILLEIDGKIYHTNIEKEGVRDGSILLTIGYDWEMIRIDTERINKDITKLVPSILSILEHRKHNK